MTARSEARAADREYGTDAPRFRIGQHVRCNAGIGVIEFIANSTAMDSPLYTVRIDPRITLRLLERDITEVL